jgi:hypothetical protein
MRRKMKKMLVRWKRVQDLWGLREGWMVRVRGRGVEGGSRGPRGGADAAREERAGRPEDSRPTSARGRGRGSAR